MNGKNEDFINNMPEQMKPATLVYYKKPKEDVSQKTGGPAGKKKSWWKIVLWLIVVLFVIALAVQYVNAAKYEALVQVIKEDRIGVNPTGAKLDFGDLPRDKSAVREVILQSKGNTASYIMVWKFGDMSDLIKVSRNYFILKPQTTEKLQFTASIPNSAEYRYYKARVIIFQIPKIW